MSYVLFLGDERHPRGMNGLVAEVSCAARAADGSFFVPAFKNCQINFFDAMSKSPLDWVIVSSYDGFVQALSSRGIPDTVCLDHDLCEGQGDSEKTGYDCAVFLARKLRDELPSECTVGIVLHSMNPVGRKNMAAAFLDLNANE